MKKEELKPSIIETPIAIITKQEESKPQMPPQTKL